MILTLDLSRVIRAAYGGFRFERLWFEILKASFFLIDNRFAQDAYKSLFALIKMEHLQCIPGKVYFQGIFEKEDDFANHATFVGAQESWVKTFESKDSKR